MNAFRTLILLAENQALAQAVAGSFGPGGAGMFTTPLSPIGQQPATHYISTGYVPKEFGYLVPLQVWGQDANGQWAKVASEPGDPVAVYENAVNAGVQCTQDDINNLFAASDVTEQEPFVALGRLGVQIINPPIELTTGS